MYVLPLLVSDPSSLLRCWVSQRHWEVSAARFPSWTALNYFFSVGMKSPWWQPHHQAVRAFQWRRAFYHEILITRVPSVNEEEMLLPGFGLPEAAQPHRLYNRLVRPRIRLMSLEIACFTPPCEMNTRHYHKSSQEHEFSYSMAR